MRPSFVQAINRPLRERGATLVELLVGVALALFILSGLVVVFVGGLEGSRRMLLEARLRQDLRAAMELITRDLRRGGYWANAISRTVIPEGVTAPVSYADPCSTTPGAAFNPYGVHHDRRYARDQLPLFPRQRGG